MPTRKCPTCGKIFLCERVSAHPTYPFCSERCRLADLGAWLDGHYVIDRPLTEDDLEDGRAAAYGGDGGEQPDDSSPSG